MAVRVHWWSRGMILAPPATGFMHFRDLTAICEVALKIDKAKIRAIPS